MDGASTPSHPYSPAALELSRDVTLMIGSTETEASNLLAYDGDPSGFDVTFATLAAKWAEYANKLGANLSAADAAVHMNALRAAHPKDTAPFIYFRAVSNLYTIFNAVTISERKAMTQGAPAYLYEITHRPQVDGGKWGSPHGMDVPLIFMNPDKSPFTRDDAECRAMSRVLAGTWAAFARNGRPDNSAIPAWPVFDQVRRPAMMLDLTSRVEAPYREVDFALMGQIPRLVI
jgi:para-nitrobenzyl esterase